MLQQSPVYEAGLRTFSPCVKWQLQLYITTIWTTRDLNSTTAKAPNRRPYIRYIIAMVGQARFELATFTLSE